MAVKKKATKKATKKVAKKATKKATKKVAKKATKKVVKAKVKRKPNPAFMKPMTPDSSLAVIVGSKALPRTQIVKKMWDYIKKHKLQDPKNKRNIIADDNLKTVFGGKSTVTMFDLAKIIAKHIS